MTAREMHYDFKQKLNKIDSQKNRDLLVPEIDWKLNEAQEVVCKTIAQPRLKSQLGFEINQRTIDDIRTIVIDQEPADYIIATVFDNSSYIITLPTNYWWLAKAKVIATKNTCQNVVLSTREIQHDDEAELSVFDRSSFEWRRANIRFNSKGLRVFTDGTFVVNKVALEYLKQPRLIYNAQDYDGGTYKTLDGTVLTGFQDCELPNVLHRDIVDMAIFLTTNDLNLTNYNIRRDKLAIINKLLV